MGNYFCKPEKKVLVLGRSGGGKTSFVQRMKTGEFSTVSVPTIGFSVEEIQYKDITFNLWDIGGADRVADLYHTYLGNANGIIFVVDSTMKEMEEEEEYLREVLYNKILGTQEYNSQPLLVLANKCDLPNALSADEVEQRLRLNTKCPEYNTNYKCISTSICQNIGTVEGFEWLYNMVK